MIVNYNNFILETNKNLLKKNYSIYRRNILTEIGYSNLNINEDGSVDVYKDVDLDSSELTYFPFKFNKIEGSFDCSSNKLTSLYNCPSYVKSDFDCNYNPLESLEYCPSHVGGFFYFDTTSMTVENRSKLHDIENYPLSIIKMGITDFSIFDTNTNRPLKKVISYDKIRKIVYDNKDIFTLLIDDKIKFHQMIMRLMPDLIPLYNTIPKPIKKSTLFI